MRRRPDIAPAVGELGSEPGGLVVAVLGYSSRRPAGLHPICAARLERAWREAHDARAVVLTGWARRRGRLPEAELMRRAWPDSGVPVVVDPHARTTAQNAALVAALALTMRADEIRVVTSGWHAARARALFRGALAGSGVRLTVVTSDDPAGAGTRLGELVRWPFVPVQRPLARRRASRRTRRLTPARARPAPRRSAR